jgi:uncharacterized protein with von Willebrand factor type A (vWA) domain
MLAGLHLRTWTVGPDIQHVEMTCTLAGRLACVPVGWLEDQPARLTNRMEYRPAAELGPIILCLDTSGSMQVSLSAQ